MKNHFSYAFRDSEALSHFIKCATKHCDRRRPEEFWEMRNEFDGILRKEIWQDVYAKCIGHIAEHPACDGGMNWHVTGLSIYESDEFSLALRSSNNNQVGARADDGGAGPGTGLVSTHPAPAMLSLMYPSQKTFSFYRLPPGFDPDVYDPDHRITHHRDECIPSWRRIEVHSSREILEIAPGQEGRWNLLEFSLKPVSAQRWEFQKSNGTPSAAILTTNRSATLLSMLNEIARGNHREALSEVAGLLDHPDFNVRWSAARCIGKLDPGALRTALQKLSSDPHPWVSSMAASALETLLNGQPHIQHPGTSA
ncbi:HEAT repeat domain-containing protein [Frateuria sp. Soil773]|uniref:HEAT repeat domain-containing protein n=1 Tax=Frateuria sp. Soil773 TaxID=1736407 RepID=UPI0009EC9EF1|nr:HEAT repeat domain-containing protein [Frateuria sp. Soil773]